MKWFDKIKKWLFGNWDDRFSALQGFGQNYGSQSNLIRNENRPSSDPFSGSGSSFGALINSVISRLTGNALTGAEREANEWTAEREDIAWQRELDASNTANQRKVQDLQAAGINPMMAVSQGVSLPTASFTGSVSPAGAAFQLGDIINMMRQSKLLPLEIEQAKANIAMTKAQSAKASSETKSIDIQNQYLDESERLRLEGIRETNKLTKQQRENAAELLSQIKAQTAKTIAETKNEELKSELIIQQTLLERANVRRISELIPYEKQLMSAQAGAARASAEAQLAQAAWQNGLIDRGALEIAFEQAGYERDSAKFRSSVERVEAQIAGDEPIEDMPEPAQRLIRSIGKVTKHMFPKVF